MTDDLEQRVAAAARAAREYELCQQQYAQLSARQQAAALALTSARQRLADEEKDVQRLEHLSLTRVLAALHRSSDDALARQRAEAEAARYQAAQAQQRLETARAELTAAASRRTELAGAPGELARALAAREQYLMKSGDPRAGRLLALAQEHGRLSAELGELRRTRADAGAAAQALAEVRSRLGTAESWSDLDTYADHGMIASAIKHDRVDQAAEAARTADERLAVLRSDLAGLGGADPAAPALEISPGLRFADIFLNNILTDLTVGRQIRAAQENVSRSQQQVQVLLGQVASQIHAVTARLGELEAERSGLLGGQSD